MSKSIPRISLLAFAVLSLCVLPADSHAFQGPGGIGPGGSGGGSGVVSATGVYSSITPGPIFNGSRQAYVAQGGCVATGSIQNTLRWPRLHGRAIP